MIVEAVRVEPAAFFSKGTNHLDITVPDAMVQLTALTLDVKEVRPSTVNAGSQRSTKAVAAKVRHIQRPCFFGTKRAFCIQNNSMVRLSLRTLEQLCGIASYNSREYLTQDFLF